MEHQPQRGKLVISMRPSGEHVVIEIEDNGPGLPPEVQAKIFDPFFTTKPVGKGTGLGLSICYRIIHNHGGTITARSRPGQGTTFCISLPIQGPQNTERQRTSTGVTS
jgi:two-component system, NtrC family, sensor kinase